ncbi:hypothetical protein [Corallococcus silvisoli]|uniref:hypothetical protein n=1 Tax=Corallococcus silvisoli TaxID=2697031 RepID=UPI001376E87D|nr:hypothetical protein [Corallococcus silvisoli]NBD09011.1 hypothetical protein [Corallococcus silvisoli]
MSNRFLFRMGLLLVTALGATGCGDSPGEEQASIELNPSSHAEARLSLERIRQLYESNPAAALDARQKLRPRLDVLNRLIVRVEVAPEHSVEFYELRPDGILVAESGPVEGGRILRDSDFADDSAVELYRRLTGGSTPPEALVRAESHRDGPARDEAVASLGAVEGLAPARGGQQGDVRSSVTQSWTGADGQLWRDTACYKGGDFVQCWPTVTGNGWASANSKSSFIKVAPYSGGIVGVWFSYELSVSGTWGVAPGEMRSFYAYSGSYKTCPPLSACGTFEYYIRNHRWDITDAVGDNYHAAIAFRWNCSYGLCGSP